MTVRISLVRHGRTAWNVDRRLLGWTDIPLDPVGRAQAVALGRSIDLAGYDAVWTSDLDRASATAGFAGWPASADSRLREIDFGEYEGLTWDGLPPDARDALVGFDGFQAPGGESAAQFVARIREFLDTRDFGAHLVVTHGGVIRAILRMCAVTDDFPAHGAVYDLDWTARTLLGGQVPTT